MVEGQYSVRSDLADQFFKRTLFSAEQGVPQAIYELAKTYITVRNFTEAIAWSRTLAENLNLAFQAIELLLQITDQASDPQVIDEANGVILEINSRVSAVAFSKKDLAEKQSFLKTPTALEVEV